jgi:alpha-tubulin suppressor-like RCC1 family protein
LGLIGTTLSFVFAFTLTGAPYASATETPGAPGPPTSVQLVSKTATSLTVSWVAPANDGGTPVSDYAVEYSADGSTWSIFNDGVSTATSALITDLVRGTAYQIRISAINAQGSSAKISFQNSTTTIGLYNKTISAGSYHTCAILADGTVKCWGHNDYGQLGDGTTSQRNTPASVSGITSSNPAAVISAGGNHSCAILTDGTVRCWGSNAEGQIGDGTTSQRNTPASVSGITSSNPAVEISAGDGYTCALLSDGTIKCWGEGRDGQLGDGSSLERYTPVSVLGVGSANSAVAISTGGNHSCAILSDGTVKCWGGNDYGQLGDGTRTRRTTPIGVSGITSANPALAISAGLRHTCALLADGTVKCWGMGRYGELGDGTSLDRYTPAGVSGITSNNPAAGISAGGHACAILADGNVKCWGSNGNGQIGDGTTAQRNTPIGVSGITSANPAVAISAGEIHTCAMFADGTVKCWGLNDTGQLGDGTTNQRTSPASVTGIVLSTRFVESEIPAEMPGSPSSVISTSKTATSATLSWSAPDNGGREITD